MEGAVSSLFYKQQLIAFILLCCPSTPLFSELTKANCKEWIALHQSQISQLPKEKQGDSKVQLALAYYYDQELEKAFKTYLEALEPIKSQSNYPANIEEKSLYDEALRLYLASNSGSNAEETAKKIRDKYEPIVKSHPNYLHLNFLVAAAYANLGLFDSFFNAFYLSYQKLPSSYMSYRTKAILHIKLYEKARTAQEKEEQKIAIFENVSLAQKAYPQDSSLYKLQIVFSPEKEKLSVVQRALLKIINENISVPRSDILFYVAEALKAKEKPLALQFLNKAKDWYQYSRIITTAQEMIDAEAY